MCVDNVACNKVSTSESPVTAEDKNSTPSSVLVR